MSQTSLQRLIGTALTDTLFRKKLLNGQRNSVLAAFDLTEEEVRFIRSIKAETLQEFAVQLDAWLTAQCTQCDICGVPRSQ